MTSECPRPNAPVPRDKTSPPVIGHRSLVIKFPSPLVIEHWPFIGHWKLLIGHSLLALLFLTSCSRDAEKPTQISSKEKAIISIARRTLDQQEDWADKAEFKIVKRSGGYEVTAWKVVHPEAKGNLRYVPWGRSTLLIEDNGRVIEYRKGK